MFSVYFSLTVNSQNRIAELALKTDTLSFTFLVANETLSWIGERENGR